MSFRGSRLLLAVAGLAGLAAACQPAAKTGTPPADLDGVWFGSWSGQDEFGYPLGSGFYFVLEHDEDSDVVSGTAFSSIAGEGVVSGSVDGSRFTLEVAYTGVTETYEGREVYGTVENGEYEGSYAGQPADGEFGMFPAELADSGIDAAGGLVSGSVFTGGGATPVEGARVSIGVGDDRQETTTNAAGSYSFPFVSGGPRVLVVSANGGETAYVPLVVDGAVTMPDINLVPGSAAQGPPEVVVSQPLDGQTTTSSVLFAQGEVNGADAPFVVASINGGEYLVPVELQAFNYALILSRGVNRVTFQSISQNGVTERTLLANANVSPQRIRVTLVWDEGAASTGGTANDQDLHVWQMPPAGGSFQHAWFNDEAGIVDGLLDVDNINGFGPENFTMPAAPAGRYFIAVNFYGGTVTTNAIVRVSLNEKTPDERVYVFGPHLMTTPNGAGGLPLTVSTDSWWRVADLTVDASGVASLAAAPNPDTAVALPE